MFLFLGYHWVSYLTFYKCFSCIATKEETVALPQRNVHLGGYAATVFSKVL